MYPPLPKRDREPAPEPEEPSLATVLLSEVLFGVPDKDVEDLLEEPAGAQGLDPQTLIGFWASVALSLIATSVLVGAVLYGVEGAFGCLAVALMASPCLYVAMLLGLNFGGATSRILAASAGATSCLAAVYGLGDAETWECRLAFIAGGLAALVAAVAYREYLARAHAVPRLRLTIRGLMARTVYAALAAAAWAASSGGW
ncbi:hypothetical protein MalM25_36780 [Planctomycetes bacterium MalM25]|nr:hypothetical protein MalM25_36780 [Planctomycetes bacterium MalM25]